MHQPIHPHKDPERNSEESDAPADPRHKKIQGTIGGTHERIIDTEKIFMPDNDLRDATKRYVTRNTETQYSPAMKPFEPVPGNVREVKPTAQQKTDWNETYEEPRITELKKRIDPNTGLITYEKAEVVQATRKRPLLLGCIDGRFLAILAKIQRFQKLQQKSELTGPMFTKFSIAGTGALLNHEQHVHALKVLKELGEELKAEFGVDSLDDVMQTTLHQCCGACKLAREMDASRGTETKIAEDSASKLTKDLGLTHAPLVAGYDKADIPMTAYGKWHPEQYIVIKSPWFNPNALNWPSAFEISAAMGPEVVQAELGVALGIGEGDHGIGRTPDVILAGDPRGDLSVDMLNDWTQDILRTRGKTALRMKLAA